LCLLPMSFKENGWHKLDPAAGFLGPLPRFIELHSLFTHFSKRHHMTVDMIT
jgi:hypothetical protein